MAVKRKIPKVRTNPNLRRFVPREIKQLEFFTPKGFAQQVQQTVSSEVSLPTLPGELRQLKGLTPAAIARQVKQQLNVREKIAVGATAVVMQEAPILLGLLAIGRKKKKPQWSRDAETIELLFKAKTDVIIIRKIKEGSLTSKKQIEEITKQQTKAFQADKKKQQEQELVKKPNVVQSMIARPLTTAATALSVGAMIALYGPMLWPFVKGMLSELIPGLIREGLMGLSKPMADFVDIFVSKKPAEVFQQLQTEAEQVADELGAAVSLLNSLKPQVENQQKQLDKKLSTIDIDLPQNVGGITEAMRQARDAEIDGTLSTNTEIAQPGEQSVAAPPQPAVQRPAAATSATSQAAPATQPAQPVQPAQTTPIQPPPVVATPPAAPSPTPRAAIAVKPTPSATQAVGSALNLQTASIDTSIAGSMRDDDSPIQVSSTKRITSPYGWRTHPVDGSIKFHPGVDIGGPQGIPIHVAVPVEVMSIRSNPEGFGNFFDVKFPDNTFGRFAHMLEINVKAGEKVPAGTRVGLMGGAKGTPGAGSSTGPHLHYEHRTKPNSFGAPPSNQDTIDPMISAINYISIGSQISDRSTAIAAQQRATVQQTNVTVVQTTQTTGLVRQ